MLQVRFRCIISCDCARSMLVSLIGICKNREDFWSQSDITKTHPKYWRNESWKIMEQWSIFFHNRIVVQEIHRWAMRRMLRTAHCGNFGGGWEVWLVEIARTTTSWRCWLILARSWYQWCWSKGKNQWKHSKQSIGLLILGWVWWHMSDYRLLWDVHNILLHCQHNVLKKYIIYWQHSTTRNFVAFDWRNPANHLIWEISPLFTGFYTS